MSDHFCIDQSQLFARTPADNSGASCEPGSNVRNAETRSFFEQLRFLNRTYEELQAVLDPNTNCVWCYMRPKGQPSFTPVLVRELDRAPSCHSGCWQPPRNRRKSH